MGDYKYSSNIYDKINKVCNDLCVQLILDFPELVINDIEPIFDKLINFIKDNHSSIGTSQFLIKLDLIDKSLTEKITSDIIIDELRNGGNLIELNSNLNILNISPFKPQFSSSAISMYSKQKECITVFVKNGVDLMIYSKGVNIKEVNVTSPNSLPVIFDKYNHPAENYKLSLKDFYKQKIRVNLTGHWDNKSKRILKGGQTEKHFQRELVKWLNDHLTCKKINYSTRKISNDETDIEIIKHGGDTYIIELKWLGENKSGTKYNIDKVEAAFDQVKNYIEIEQDVLEISLVTYDGREIAEFEKLICIEEETGNWKEIKECNAKYLPKKATGFIFYLVNKSASKRPAV